MPAEFGDEEAHIEGFETSLSTTEHEGDPQSNPSTPTKSVAFSVPVGEETALAPPPYASNAANSSLEEIDYVDHYSLRTPSCAVRFKKAMVRVYPQRYSQLLLEERFQLTDGRSVRHLDQDDMSKVKKREITVKRMSDSTFGLMLLRAVYTLIAVFIVGFLLVYALQLLLYIFLDIIHELGLTSDNAVDAGQAVGSILSIPIYVHGMACALVISFNFVSDTWGGHQMMRMMYPWSVVVTDWIAFLVFIGIPLFVGTIALFAGSDDWYQILLLTWFGCIIIFIGLYALAVVIHEVRACIKLVRALDVKYSDQRFGSGEGFFGFSKRVILLRQANRFSGSKRVSYIARGGVISKNSVRDHDFKERYATSERYDVAAKFGLCLAKRDRKGLVRVVDPPVQIYSTDESRGIMPVTTSYNWSLERIYCRNRNQRRIAVVKGPGAMTRAQARSNFACSILGKLLVLLGISSFLAWMDLNGAAVAIAAVLIVIWFFWSMRRDYSLFRNYRRINDLKTSKFEDMMESLSTKAAEKMKMGSGKNEGADQEEGAENKDGAEHEEYADNDGQINEQSEGLYNVKETYRVTRPTNKLCYFFTFFEIVAFFCVPFFTFMANESYSLGLFFLFIAVFSGIRYYLNAPVLLQELGTLDLLTKSADDKNLRATVREGRGVVTGKESAEEKWVEMHRISEIVGNISKGRSEKLLKAVFAIFVIVLIVLLGVAAATNSDTDLAEKPATLLNDFAYKGMPDLRYPTCQLEKGLIVEEGITPAAADYAFLSQIAYRGSVEVAQREMNQWFGPGNAIYNETLVEQFKLEAGFVGTRAEYRLVTFPSIPDFAVVAVRGTNNAFDALTDLQIWSAAALVQGLRFILPAGEAWNPSLHNIVNFMSILETAKLTEVSFYKETTAFVNWLRSKGEYTNLQITGHSLGGGLSIITGAQTGIPAIAVSGPNAMISRLTFDPPVTTDALNSMTFNIVPERDVVPMIDDKANLYQMIECNAATNDPVGCHSIGRSLCQLMYACGSDGKPVPCFCADDYDFPEPEPIGNRTYEDACRFANKR